MKKRSCRGGSLFPALPLIILIISLYSMAGAEIHVVDAKGRSLFFEVPPTRVVSMVPAATEIICTLRAEQALAGVTFDSTRFVKNPSIKLVGSVLYPDISRITAINPDLVFVSKALEKTAEILEARGIKVLFFDTASFSGSLDNIQTMGRIFDRKAEAAKILADIRKEIDLIQQKTAKIPREKRKRVFRLVGSDNPLFPGIKNRQAGKSGLPAPMEWDHIMTPAKGSLFNEMVELAGGIPMGPQTDAMTAMVSLDKWRQFNPQVIFGCKFDKKTGDDFFHLPGWNSVDAVNQGKIYYFPCELADQAACNTGHFVQWLASFIYSDLFFSKDNQIQADGILGSEPVEVDLGIIKESRQIKICLADFTHKTLVIDFNEPQTVLSTLEGIKHKVLTIANHYLPPPSWAMPHTAGLAGTNNRILSILKRAPASTSLLMTGADMDNLTVTEKHFKQMRAIALVTAGVLSNAQRMGRDVGDFYEPGTINIIIMTNMKLSERAMARAIITATEAKTAALADLDIRSSFQGLDFQATGTGTDNIIVVQGAGLTIDNTGGHSKMGELIATAVHQGVTRAIFLQNGLSPGRNIFQRLKERGITPHGLARHSGSIPGNVNPMACQLESLLMDPAHAGLVEMALALSDAEKRGQAKDLTLFATLARKVGETIAGEPVSEAQMFDTTKSLPIPLKMVFNWLMTGIERQKDKEQK